MAYNGEETGKRIRELRKSRNLTQQDIATLRGMTQSAVAKQEAGITEIGDKGLTWYADYYSVSVDYLLGLTDKPYYEHKSGNTIYLTTSKKPPDVSGGEPDPAEGKTFTVNSDDLPASRQELEQFVRNLLREVIPNQKIDEPK